MAGARDPSRAPAPQPSSLPGDVDVAVVHWPEEREKARALVEHDRPCLLLVGSETLPPLLTECLVDWVRTPATDADVRARINGLTERVAQHPAAPSIDEFGQLSYRGDHVFLSLLDEQVARVLVDSFGHGVAKEDLCQPDWSDEDGGAERVRLYVTRLRRRIAPLGLGITAVRGFGYYLHEADSRR